MSALARAEAEAFIRARLRVAPVACLPHIRLYMAHAGSRLSQLEGPKNEGGAPPPYWAYPWAGGMVLALYFAERPETVAGKRVLDLGAGSGLVGIAAAKAGAREIIAAETDCYAVASIGLNAAENAVAIAIVTADMTRGPPPAVDLVAVGDLFYEPRLARAVTPFLARCRQAGIEVLVGDPGRAYLPLSRLRALAHYDVPDFGAVRGDGTGRGTVFAFEPAASLSTG